MVNVEYTLDIPATNNNPSTDQPKMLLNTNAIDTLLSVDHISFNADNGGFHKKVTLPSTTYTLGAPPVPNFSQMILFTALTGTPLGSVLAYTKDGSSTAYPLMSSVNPSVTSSFQASGHTSMLGGVIMQWGTLSGGGSNTGSISFPIQFPNAVFGITFGMKLKNASNAHSVWITIDGSNNPQLSTSGFTWKSDVSTFTNQDGFYWQALGN